jgi:modulator of FtsH protease HflC
MRVLGALLVVILGVAAAAVYLSAYIVKETEQAVVLQFGDPKRVVTEPGLQWKIPVFQTVVYYDKRILDLDTTPQEVIAADQKRLVVDSFARFKIVDPLEFYKTVRSEQVARIRLSAFLEAGMRSALGAATMEDIVRNNREGLMRSISQRVNEEARGLGINVIDVRMKRADLPDENSEAIYNRMRTDREQEAAELRAEGAATANRIRATSERQRTVILAEATRKSEQLRGDGDAERNRIFNDAFGRDPEFFAFYRSMQAYERSLSSNDTRLILSPDSEFFKYFGRLGGATGDGAAAPQPR